MLTKFCFLILSCFLVTHGYSFDIAEEINKIKCLGTVISTDDYIKTNSFNITSFNRLYRKLVDNPIIGGIYFESPSEYFIPGLLTDDEVKEQAEKHDIVTYKVKYSDLWSGKILIEE